MDETPKSAGRRAFVRVRADRDARGTPIRDAEGRVVVRLVGGVGGQGSHVLSALAEAEALAIIPEDVAIHPAGGAVDLWWLDADSRALAAPARAADARVGHHQGPQEEPWIEDRLPEPSDAA